ncbi:hypothetical protein [Streptomyces lavendofoliae]|uniref:Uncharacterized protein n=1 Tax=Streptomyces lavendofoliae TaxID=67314 RepID=A0A918HZG7_9ACTN|nr:hypothetical protein [Streptomyces lavendofoliae]GGU47509.1 hypothetical protein GCM10010274_39900 [Streptomyces lavendofoliae]
MDEAAPRDRLPTEHAVLVRECGDKLGSSSRFLRLVVRPPHVVGQLARVLYGARAARVRRAGGGPMAMARGYTSSGTAAVGRLVSG